MKIDALDMLLKRAAAQSSPGYSVSGYAAGGVAVNSGGEAINTTMQPQVDQSSYSSGENSKIFDNHNTYRVRTADGDVQPEDTTGGANEFLSEQDSLNRSQQPGMYRHLTGFNNYLQNNNNYEPEKIKERDLV